MFTRSIYLVGMTASGKTTIGKELANQLDFPFYDSDQELEKRAGASVSWIFDVEGESVFRRREAKVIDELSQMKNIVLATGGGAVLRRSTRDNLTKRGFVVYLMASVTRLLDRVGEDSTRPLLQADDPANVLERMQEERDPIYADVADVTFDTEDYLNSHAVADAIATWYRTVSTT